MVNIHRKIEKSPEAIRMLMQIHDELVFECRSAECEKWRDLIKTEMEGAMSLKVPLKVDIGMGKNWLEYE